MRVCGLSKRYGEKQALDRLDLRVNLTDANPSTVGEGTMLRPAASGADGTRSRMSMSEQGCSSPLP